jgi:hypothetical protein
MEKPEIKFWFDEFERKIMIVHIPSGRKRELKRRKDIKRFLAAHKIIKEEWVGVKRDLDRLVLFARKRFWWQRK